MSQPNRTSAAARRARFFLAALLLSPALALAQDSGWQAALPPSPSAGLEHWSAAAPAAPPSGAPASSPAAARAAPPPSAADRIDYQVVPVVSGHHHTVETSLAAVPILARDGRPLAGEELFQRLGRPDLVAELHAREGRRTLLVGLGAAISLGGLVYVVTRPAPDVTTTPEQFRRAMDAESSAQAAGVVAMLGGAAVSLAGLLTDPSPVSEAEVHRLIDAHNAALPPRVGEVAPRPAEGAEDEGPRPSFQAGPIPGGGMARVGVAF